MKWQCLGYNGSVTILLKLNSPDSSLSDVDTRKFEIPFVACIVFLVDSAGLRYRKGSVEKSTQLLWPILCFLSLLLYCSMPEARGTIYLLVNTTSSRRNHTEVNCPVSLLTDLPTYRGVLWPAKSTSCYWSPDTHIQRQRESSQKGTVQLWHSLSPAHEAPWLNCPWYITVPFPKFLS